MAASVHDFAIPGAQNILKIVEDSNRMMIVLFRIFLEQYALDTVKNRVVKRETSMSYTDKVQSLTLPYLCMVA